MWRTLLPSVVELYNIAEDPSERQNVAEAHPEKVAALQKRINKLAAESVRSPLLQTEWKELLKRLAMPPALPGEEFELNQEP